VADMELSILPFVLFCLVATGTPGPNNMINLAQGIRLGFCRSLPFALGTGLGVASLLIAMAFGLGAAFQAVPWLNAGMRVATIAFLLFLAWKIAMAGPMGQRDDVVGLGFLSGIGFQWVNPKTWASAMTMATTYLPPRASVPDALVAGAIFCAIAWLMQPVWIGFGTALRRLLSDARRATMINIGMAILLLASTLPVLVWRT
jgi:threonine/homoserine/homoserine lactone efflux protein